ncbi:hypothetical protein [Limimaricola sp. AA108-03]|uniref:hypothetical protein n=1 Tax=Limimaricola sp. AA108-03 TaxID=3425945 RepID=UPI003D789D65
MSAQSAICYSAKDSESVHIEAVAADLLCARRSKPRPTPLPAMPKVALVTPKPGRRKSLSVARARLPKPVPLPQAAPVEAANRPEEPAAPVDCFLFR